jgi:hypothetical protein
MQPTSKDTVKVVESYDSEDIFHADEIVLRYRPYPSNIKLVVPEVCLNRRRGSINIRKLVDYLQNVSENGVSIEYEVICLN